MGWLKNLAKCLTLSSMVGAMGLSLAGGIGCAEETFKCCEGAFEGCVDAMGATVTYYLCDCPSGDTYTYEECGVFMKQQLTQAELDTRAAADAGLSMCALPAKQGTVLAKNSCSPGWPVGDPP